MRDTIDMAREANLAKYGDGLREGVAAFINALERFEAIVRADEREACAKVCESEADMFKSCAYGANDGRYDWKEDGARDCAVAIRNRGNT
jgi:hypothetical protein